jgi:peptidyl-prolyl cis-trans isomerase A (cyclophilin A)
MPTFARASIVAATVVVLATLSPSPAARADTSITPSGATATAPATYKVKMATTKGDFVLEVHRDWSPLGADRFYNLVKLGYYNDLAFFRVVKGFMVQFGIHGNPALNQTWRHATINDDPQAKHANARGTISFATSGPNKRTTQVFINYGDNSRLDAMGFTPFGKVVEGMEVVDAIDGTYGEGAPSGRGPAQEAIQTQGNTYLKAQFPKLDYIKSATLLSR